MAITDTEYVTAFDAEAGAVSTLATTAQKILWWNQGLARLGKYKPKTQDVTWAAADRSVTLSSDFVELDKLVTTVDYVPQPWRVFGETLVLDTSEGASQAGGARVYYWADWPPMTSAPAYTSPLLYEEDYALMFFALSRFYKRLASNRAYYKRYATMVGANAVSMTDLQQEADRYYQDFLESREDVKKVPPAFFYES